VDGDDLSMTMSKSRSNNKSGMKLRLEELEMHDFKNMDL
jgi:hypothetical protein